MADIRILETPEDFSLYDTWVKSHPQGSLWQSLEWKRYQETLGREVRIYIGGGNTIVASAMVVIDRTTGGLSTWDVARGPLCQLSGVSFQVSGDHAAARLLDVIAQDAKRDRCLALFLSPSIHLKAGIWKLEASCRHEQPEATRMIDLAKSAEEILAQMHPKGRYNIKVSQKNGVLVEQSDDIEAFYGLLRQTAGRDGFRILPLKAYKAFLECLPGSFLLIAYLPPPPAPPPFAGEGSPPSPQQGGRGQGMGAFSRKEKEVEGGGKMGTTPIAGLIGVVWGQTGIYYYGASDYASRSLMAPYALQWEAMRLCKTKGCTTYDLLGVAPSAPLTLPSPAGRGNTAPHPALSPSDRVSRAGRGERETAHQWAGVSTFKEKFGGVVVTSPPEQQIVLRPVLWKVLQWKRWMVG